MNRIVLGIVPIIALGCAASAKSSDAPATTTITADRVKAEEVLLAGPGLRGRGSATPDEAIAAGYVASLFRDFGLKTAPGMDGYLQTAPVIRQSVSSPAIVKVNGVPIAGTVALMSSGGVIGGKAALVRDLKGELPKDEVIVYTGPDDDVLAMARLLRGKDIRLLIVPAGARSQRFLDMMGGKVTLPTILADTANGESPMQRKRLAIAALPAAAIGRIKAGSDVSLDVPVASSPATTTNAIGYLPGTDPKAGVILLSAHLDHLGVRPDGTVMPGANDDASGTVAVIELARAFAGMKPMKRGILFVAYGSEEIGGLGSTYFGAHPPVPLSDLVANIEFEMIGAQDPKLPKGALMMTGSERSTLFDMMRSQGALIARDPYPDQHFFERSDNYSLAARGIVAHTFSGWAVVPTYHQPTDTVDNIDIAYMTDAIRSLVAPIRLLASGRARPEWKPGGKP